MQRDVLVVDDSPTVCRLVSSTLEKRGFKVLIANNGLEALASLQEAIPHLVFLDITLPHLDGYEICRVIKENDLTQEVPVVFLSSKDGFFDRVRGRKVGAVEYLTKPVDPKTLIRIVEKYCPQVCLDREMPLIKRRFC